VWLDVWTLSSSNGKRCRRLQFIELFNFTPLYLYISRLLSLLSFVGTTCRLTKCRERLRVNTSRPSHETFFLQAPDRLRLPHTVRGRHGIAVYSVWCRVLVRLYRLVFRRLCVPRDFWLLSLRSFCRNSMYAVDESRSSISTSPV
jgi:hypothetical protein